LRTTVVILQILAQTLVRRELFPSSNCLKASQRIPMISAEIIMADPDIICLQEVDRLEQLLTSLRSRSYAHTFACGKGKNHGCAILHKDQLYTKVEEQTVFYDDLRLQECSGWCGEGSFLTKNVGLIVALRRKNSAGDGLIVATTHLFWHPKYAYERARQAGILLRAVQAFRESLGNQSHWPCVIAGDFNCSPEEGTYRLMVGEKLSSSQIEKIENSRVVHASVDTLFSTASDETKTVPVNEEGDPDRVITNARRCLPHDGLLSVSELEHHFQQFCHVRSAYSEASRFSSMPGIDCLGPLSNMTENESGFFEPVYTAYAHYWKATLDYVFLLDPKRVLQVLGVTESPPRAIVDPGLPRMGVCASDHISLTAELVVDYPSIRPL